MKKLLSIFLLGMICSSAIIQSTDEEVQEIHEIQDTVELENIHYLTDEELSRLYSCKSDIRHVDEKIISLSQEDAWLLMKIAVAEDSTDIHSQALIMSVILNRVNSDEFPNTVKEVINQSKQFAPLRDGRFKKAVPDNNSHLALAEIEMGNINTDYLYFESKYCEDSWASKNRGTPYEYGESRFYK